jgi:class 3 adenylate cyclase
MRVAERPLAQRPRHSPAAPQGSGRQPVRVLVWVLHLGFPLAGLWLLLAQPELDARWQHGFGHLALVLAVALTSMAVGGLMGRAAGRRGDARLFLVSLSFLTSAGFLGLHALATPGALAEDVNAGFDLAQPVGLAIAGVFALVSSWPLGPAAAALIQGRARLQFAVIALLVGWLVVALLDLPPVAGPPPDRDSLAMLAPAGLSIAAFTVAAGRYWALHRRRPAVMLISLVTAFTLLAEAALAAVAGERWHLSWWEWHLLLLAGFGFVAYSAHVQYRREGSAAGLFDSITLAETRRQVRHEYETALEQLVGALEEQERSGAPATAPVAARVAARFDLSEGQAAVLDRAGAALAAERGLSRRLGALVGIGEQTRIRTGEAEFLAAALARARQAYGQLEVATADNGLVRVGGRQHETAALAAGPVTWAGRVLWPLTVRGQVAGVLAAPAPAGPSMARDRAMLDTLAGQLSISLENVRLYAELTTLFRQYLSPDVAAALLADPGQAALGGSMVEVTALFADLRGFTTFSEQVSPSTIVDVLNRYHSVAVPAVLGNGGTVVQFVGDALLALFNAPARQPDHPRRAVRAALDLQRGVAELAAGQPGWPQFRVGINTGPALVGNIGSEQLRGFNAMGDAVNVAARLQNLAEPGQVVIGAATRVVLGAAVTVEPLGDLALKGRTGTTTAYVVTGLQPAVGS